MGACEVSLITVSLQYPCTDEQLRQALSHQGRIPSANIVVIPKNAPEELLRDECDVKDETTKKYEPILTQEELQTNTDSEVQLKVGQSRVDNLLKELESRRYSFSTDKVNLNKDKK
jgi:hypothetical protein